MYMHPQNNEGGKYILIYHINNSYYNLSYNDNKINHHALHLFTHYPKQQALLHNMSPSCSLNCIPKHLAQHPELLFA